MVSNAAPDVSGRPAVAIPECDRTGGLFADTGLKLGLFGVNVTSAGALTRWSGRHEIDWQQNVALVRMADEAGFDAAIPFSRWRGFEGDSNPWGSSFETYTWAAGLAALTERIAIFSTSHSLTVSPVMAAKQIATIDHISGGRVGLNVVAGWFEKELRMFGAHALDHDARYDYAEEWLEVVERLWTEDEEFDHHGPALDVERVLVDPKPLQKPRPPVMNAAFSPRGHRFAAKYADIAFVSAFDPEAAGRKAEEIRAMAAEEGRDLQVWVAASVICAESRQAAQKLVERYEADTDSAAARNCIEWTMGIKVSDEQREAMIKNLGTTMAGYPLIGGPEDVAEQLATLADAGIDGVGLTWMSYERGLPTFIEQVLPLLHRGGVRRTHP